MLNECVLLNLLYLLGAIRNLDAISLKYFFDQIVNSVNFMQLNVLVLKVGFSAPLRCTGTTRFLNGLPGWS